jgi:hypothetical protein
MSVTITISGNREFCEANNLGSFTEYDCQRCEWAGKVDPECPECKPYGGNGKVRFKHLPFEMNVANGNFHMLWNALGLEPEYCGGMDGRKIQATLRTFDSRLLVRETRDVPATESSVRVIFCGVDADRAASYVSRLSEIADEAARREEQVVWG